MSLLDRLFDQNEWMNYYNNKIKAGNISKDKEYDLLSFIETEEYLPLVKSISTGATFESPHKTYVNKMSSSKKRVVYTYGRVENYVLKMITFLLKEYDDIFADNLYSFRKNKGVKCAVENILQMEALKSYYTYKVDISDYFNSVNIEILLPMLSEIFREDRRLYEFIKSLLANPFVYENGILKEDRKGIMAGTPIASFLANVYLKEMDEWFADRGCYYARYSDDVIVFAKTEQELCDYINKIKDTLFQYDLQVNKKKEIVTSPGEMWTFLGFSYQNDTLDVSPVSIEKIKNKMRRKVRALKRWQRKNGVSGENTAKAFIRHFNRVFYENKKNNELTWTRWYFPIINTTHGLENIDHFMQEQIRYLATGTRTKAKYNLRYEEMKKLGYRSLVSSYYN
ncbi:MAG: hypothetical protein E7253_04310 [Lachnospiraceae bacterium]|nr:hypothetical protein [Lachnospiraceae bacterium]